MVRVVCKVSELVGVLLDVEQLLRWPDFGKDLFLLGDSLPSARR